MNSDLKPNAAPNREDMADKAGADAVNRELEAFSRSVAHDLRTPLNQITGLSSLLLKGNRTQLDEQGVEHLNRIQDAAHDMTQLLEDLIKLAHITRSELSRSTIDLSHLARDIVARLRLAYPERQVQFIMPDGLAAAASGDFMRIVLENLLGKAFKSSARRLAGRIEFGVRHDGLQEVYFVRDNDAGFDPKCADETGISLNTMKRIVQMHGGRFWIEYAFGKGTTFCFSLG